jgi:hypothetical protein
VLDNELLPHLKACRADDEAFVEVLAVVRENSADDTLQCRLKKTHEKCDMKKALPASLEVKHGFVHLPAPPPMSDAVAKTVDLLVSVTPPLI